MFVLGSLMFVGLPVVIVGHLVLMFRDHRAHRSVTVTLLALPWLFLAYVIAMSVEMNMGPPLFGVPIAALLLGAWSRRGRLLVIGFGIFLLLSTLLIVGTAFQDPAAINPIAIVLGGPGTIAMVMVWRRARVLAVAALHATDPARA